MKSNMAIWNYVLIGLLVVSSGTGSLRADKPKPIPAEERAALIALYNATNGDNWSNNSGWKYGLLHTDGFAKPGTENKWFGVTVVGGHVIKIHLSDNKLNGFIPSQTQDLKFLSILNVKRNPSLTEISPGLGKIVTLEKIDVSYCGLSRLPEAVGKVYDPKKNLFFLETYLFF